MTKKELVFVANAGLSHLLSVTEFAKHLVQHDQRISVLIIVFHIPMSNPAKSQAYIESQAREVDPNRITFLTLPPLSKPPDPSSVSFFHAIVELHMPLVKQVVTDREPRPVAMVLDLANASMIDVANELNVPSYVYFPTGANLLNLTFHLQALADDEGVDVVAEFGDPDVQLDVPGFRNKVPTKVLPWDFRENSGWFTYVLNLGRKFREAKGIIVNTLVELESCVIQALQDHGKSHIPSIYPVGPILALDETSRSGSQGEDDRDSIMQWLDEQPSSSVVFLCFGSMGSFEADQVKEIANGLDRSGCRFLWSLRKPLPKDKFGFPGEHESFQDALPEGFLDRTAHRGKIIGWAPQVAVLAHRAVGGFVSHCGWNSILESMWFGVPIATWPVYGEQQLNAFELVKELGIAVEIRMDYRWDVMTKKRNFLVKAEEIENGLKLMMSMDEELKGRVKKMSEKCRNALEDGGSSHDWLTRFIGDVVDDVARDCI